MEAIQNILLEELDNSKRLYKNYALELKKLPRGSLVKKKIHHQFFYYLAYRIEEKVHFEYLGKLKPEQIQQYKKNQQKRKLVKKLQKDAKNQIVFLERALRVKRK